MTQTPPVRPSGNRRSQRYVQEEAPDTRKRKKKISKINIIVALAFVAFLTVMVLVCPKEPVSQAWYTVGTEDNVVDQTKGTTGNEYAGLVISEMMPSNRAAVPDENGEYTDWVEIWNSSDHDINLREVGLSDRSDSIRFLFPDVTLPADGRVVVYCSDTNQAEAGRPYHAKFKLSSVGETVYLYDRNAYLLDEVTMPIMSSDESYALQEDGTFAATASFSPGYENSTAGYEAYLKATMVADGALIINEICPDPLTGYRDADGELCDWLELYNTTDQPISLNNYALSNKEGKPLKWRFPENAVVAPHGYYLVFCSGKDIRNDPTAIPHANFRISAEHDTLVLSDSHGRLVDRVIIDNIPEDASYARDGQGNFTIQTVTTPALPNDQSGRNSMDYNLRAMNPTGVYISEVMASNDTTEIASGLAEFVDWVEIYNSSAVTVDLSGYGFSDNIGRARKWQFPQGTTIAPGQYMLIRCDGDVASSTAAQPHTSFKIMRGGSEVLCLSDPTGRILDRIVLPLIPTNVSYGRTKGLAGFFYYELPTPGLENNIGFLGYAEAPQLSAEPGLHYQAVQTTLTIPDGATVYYTLDGSVPTREAGTPYHGETINIAYTTVIRARAFPDDPQYSPSTVTTATYLINAYHSLPVVSVVVDPWDLWNPETGMLTIGDDIIKEGPGMLPWKNTVYRYVKDELDNKEGYVEYYLQDGTQVFSQGVSIGLIGDFSLDMPQKSMKIRAKSLYGEKTFAAAIFEDRPYTEYKSLVLRNSGNDCAWTRLLDGFQSRLLDAYGTQVVHQAWKPVAVYLNGVYWGHYNLRERVDRFMIAQFEGLPLEEAGNMDILEASNKVAYGSNKEYKEMIKKIKASDPVNNPEDLKYIEDNIDIENHLEYMALEMFVGNSDIGNTRFYRLHQEGSKWKWIWYDADYGLYRSGFDSPASYTKEKGMGQHNIDNTIFRTLLSIPKYKDMFLRKLGDIFQTFTTEFMSEILDECVAAIKPEMEIHFSRWAPEHDQMVIQEWPTTPDGAYRYWEQRINRLYNTLMLRPNKLWGMVQNAFKLTDEQMIEYLGPCPEIPPEAVQ